MTKDISSTSCLLAFAILYGVSNCEPSCTKLLVRCYFNDAFNERKLDKINKSVHNPQLVSLIKAKLFDKGSLLETVFDEKTEVIIEEETIEEESDDTVIPLDDIRTAATSTTVNKKSVIKTFRDFIDIPQMRNLGLELLEDWINSPELSQSIGSFLSALADFVKKNADGADGVLIIDKLLLIQQKAMHQLSEPLSKLFTATPELAKYTLAKIIQIEYTNQTKIMTSKYLIPIIKHLGENGIQVLASIFVEIIKYEPHGQVSEQFANTTKHLFKFIDNTIDFPEFFKCLIKLASESGNNQLYSICFVMQLAVIAMTKQGVINECQTLLSQNTSQKYQQSSTLSGTSSFTPSRKLVNLATTVSVVQSYVASTLRQSEGAAKPEDTEQFMKYASLAEFMPQITFDPLDKRVVEFIQFGPKSLPVPLPYNTLLDLTNLLSKESLSTILLPIIIRGIKADRLKISSSDTCLSIPETQAESFIAQLLAKTEIKNDSNIYNASSFWNVILIIAIITSVCPQTIGKIAIQVPVLQLTIKAVIRSKFDFPPSTDQTEQALIMSQATTSERESNEIIKKCGMENNRTQRGEADLIAFDKEKVYKAPEWFWHQLQCFSDELRMKYLLCSSRDPDFLLYSLPNIKNDDSIYRSMKLLLKLLKDDAGLIQVFPSEVLLTVLGFIVSTNKQTPHTRQSDKQNEQQQNTTPPQTSPHTNDISFSMLQHHRKRWTDAHRTFNTPGLNSFVTNFLSTTNQPLSRTKSSLKSSTDQYTDADVQTELANFLPQIISQIREKLANPSEKERLLEIFLQKLKSYKSRDMYKKILNELFNEATYNSTDTNRLEFLRYFSRHAESMTAIKKEQFINTLCEVTKEESDYTAVIKYSELIHDLTQSSVMPANCLREIMLERKFIFRVMFENDTFAAYCYEVFANASEETNDDSFFYGAFYLLTFPLSQSTTAIPNFSINLPKLKNSLLKHMNTTFSGCISQEDWKRCFNGNCVELMKMALSKYGYKLLETFSTETPYSLTGLQTLVQFVENESENLLTLLSPTTRKSTFDESFQKTLIKSVNNIIAQANLHDIRYAQSLEKLISQSVNEDFASRMAKSSPLATVFENNNSQIPHQFSINAVRTISQTPAQTSILLSNMLPPSTPLPAVQSFSQQQNAQHLSKENTIQKITSIHDYDMWINPPVYKEQPTEEPSEMEVEDIINSIPEINVLTKLKMLVDTIFEESSAGTRKQEFSKLFTLSQIAHPADALQLIDFLNEQTLKRNNAKFIIQDCEKELFLLTNLLIHILKTNEKETTFKQIQERNTYSVSNAKKTFENFIKNMCKVISQSSNQKSLSYWFTLIDHNKLFEENAITSSEDITNDFMKAINSPLSIEHLASLWSRTPHDMETTIVDLGLKQFNESQKAQLKFLFAAYFCSLSSEAVNTGTSLAKEKGFDYFIEFGDFKKVKEIISEEFNSTATVALMQHLKLFLSHPMLIASNYLFQSNKLEKTLNVISFDKFKIKKLLNVLIINTDNLSETDKKSFLSMILGIIKAIHGSQERNETIQFLSYWIISQCLRVCNFSHLKT